MRVNEQKVVSRMNKAIRHSAQSLSYTFEHDNTLLQVDIDGYHKQLDEEDSALTVQQGVTFMIAGVMFFILGTWGLGSSVIIWLNNAHYPYVEDLPFDYWDHEIPLELPGLWFPWKDGVCRDFYDTWIGESWPCWDSITITLTIFKT